MTKAIFGARLPRLAAGVSLGLLMAASGYSAAAAGEVTPSSVNGIQHFFDCFGVLIHDGQTHQQYCSPGNAAGPGNSSLGSFSGGAGPSCVEYVPSPPPVGMLAPAFNTVDVASLAPDFYVNAPTLKAPTFAQKISYCCDSSLSAPVFATYQTASLDDSIGSERQQIGRQRIQFANGCA
jgi:hypothetical protein